MARNTSVGKNAPRPLGRPKGSGSQVVYDELRHQILSLVLRPGTPIDELALVSMFNVSRTPVREALIKLEAEGLVEIVPNRGASVAPMDFDNIGRLFEALDLYSRAICHLAALRGDRPAIDSAKRASREFAQAAEDRNFREMGEANWRFHNELARASGNIYLEEAQARALNESMRLAYIVHFNSVKTRSDYRNYFSQIIGEHELMVDHIVERNTKEAERLAGQHTRLFQENVARYVKQNDLESIRLADTLGD